MIGHWRFRRRFPRRQNHASEHWMILAQPAMASSRVKPPPAGGPSSRLVAAAATARGRRDRIQVHLEIGDAGIVMSLFSLGTSSKPHPPPRTLLQFGAASSMSASWRVSAAPRSPRYAHHALNLLRHGGGVKSPRAPVPPPPPPRPPPLQNRPPRFSPWRLSLPRLS